jgi:hypothetical protein
MAAKFTHLSTRDDNPLARQPARTAALLRWQHVVITRHVSRDSVIAAGGTSPLRTAA